MIMIIGGGNSGKKSGRKFAFFVFHILGWFFPTLFHWKSGVVLRRLSHWRESGKAVWCGPFVWDFSTKWRLDPAVEKFLNLRSLFSGKNRVENLGKTVGKCGKPGLDLWLRGGGFFQNFSNAFPRFFHPVFHRHLLVRLPCSKKLEST